MGRSQPLLAVLQHLVLFGSKGLEAEQKKEVGEGQPPSFLMRKTKRESIFLHLSKSVPQLPNHKGKGRDAEDDPGSTSNLLGS